MCHVRPCISECLHLQGKVEQSVSTLKALVRAAGELCPWPGDAAAALLSGLLDMGERALINRRNWQQLNARAVDLLQVGYHGFTLGSKMSHMWRRTRSNPYI